jgi:hypothetical protein
MSLLSSVTTNTILSSRIIISNSFMGLTAMQVCAEADVTDEEILEHCNTHNPAGTTNGWCHVCRNETGAFSANNPVKCDANPERLHFRVEC